MMTMTTTTTVRTKPKQPRTGSWFLGVRGPRAGRLRAPRLRALLHSLSPCGDTLLARLGDAPGGAGRRVHELDAALLKRAPDLIAAGEVLGLAGRRALGDACLDGSGIDAPPSAQAQPVAVEEGGRGTLENSQRRAAGCQVVPQSGQRPPADVLGGRVWLVEQLVGQQERLRELADGGGGVEVVVHRLVERGERLVGRRDDRAAIVVARPRGQPVKRSVVVGEP